MRPRTDESLARRADILAALAAGPLTISQLREETGLTCAQLHFAFARILAEGDVIRVMVNHNLWLYYLPSMVPATLVDPAIGVHGRHVQPFDQFGERPFRVNRVQVAPGVERVEFGNQAWHSHGLGVAPAPTQASPLARAWL